MTENSERESLPPGVTRNVTPGGDHEKLNLAMKLRDYHHNAIWEEQKHFTWLISIILSGQLIALSGARLDQSAKLALILTASVVGVLLSVTAFRVQRREGEFFRNANARFIAEYNALYPEAPMAPPGPLANKSVVHLVTYVFSGRSGVRDYFQFLFLSFAVIFAGIALFACITL
jgi:hypothetical protein